MITNGFAVLIGTVILAVYLIYALIRKRPVKRIIVTCIFIIYLVGVAIVTLFPIVYDDLTEYTDAVTWYNFTPFKTIISAFQNGITATAVTQIIGNIALSVPFGVLVLLLFKLPRRWQKLVIALSFTIAIESSQLFIGFAIGNMYRNIDIDDIILNLSGAYIGYGLYAILPQRIKQLFL
ncbi:MAG: VanZ family protein [Ruminococcus sp.]|nr:VanZ family protein [Ruminococcus sp.]